MTLVANFGAIGDFYIIDFSFIAPGDTRGHRNLVGLPEVGPAEAHDLRFFLGFRVHRRVLAAGGQRPEYLRDG